MSKYSSDKDINKMVRRLLKKGWTIRPGKKHRQVVSPFGRRVTIPSTPSDHRASKNFIHQVYSANAKGIALH